VSNTLQDIVLTMFQDAQTDTQINSTKLIMPPATLRWTET